MAPRDRRRRSRRDWRVPVVVGAVVLVVLLLLIGGLVETGAASSSNWRSINRSYAAQATALVHRSNQLSATATAEIPALPAQSRATLRAQLDDLASQTQDVTDQVEALTPPQPEGSADQQLVAAMQDRSQAMASLRGALYGILGMHPAAVVGAAPATVSETADRAPSPDTVAGATAAITTSQRLLSSSNRTYADFRRSMAESIGHPKVPASVWHISGSSAFPNALAQAVDASSTLAPLREVVLAGDGASQAIRVEPTPVPAIPAAGSPSPTPGSPSTVPPTNTLTVTVTVSNLGTVDEPSVPVSASVTPVGGTSTTVRTARRTVSLGAGSSLVVSLPALRVKPGTTYILNVSVRPVPGQRIKAHRIGVTALYQITVAPL